MASEENSTTFDRWYKLDSEGNVVPGAPRDMSGSDRVVAKTECGGAEVSTVFLGLDHRHVGKGAPVVFETLIFGGDRDGDGERYCTLEEAKTGHGKWVNKLRHRIRESITITATAQGEGIPESWRGELSRALDLAIDLVIDDIVDYVTENLEEPPSGVKLKVGAEPAS